MDMETFRITVQGSDLVEHSTVWKMDTSSPTEVLSSAGWGDAEARMLVVPRAQLHRASLQEHCHKLLLHLSSPVKEWEGEREGKKSVSL